MLSTKGFAENVSGKEIQDQRIFQTEQAGTIAANAGEAFWVTEQLT